MGICINLIGGLGNCMYIYAIGRKLSILNGTDLYINNSHLLNYAKQYDKNRGYTLGGFNIKGNVVNTPSPGYRVYGENTSVNCFDSNVLNQKGNICLNGYWQSYKYFDDIKDVLLEDFNLKDKMSDNNLKYLDMIDSSDSVSFHIRRGDKSTPIKMKRFPFYGIDYFNKAKVIIEKQIKTPTYFIFSDDMPWCKQNIKGDNIVYIEGNDDKVYEDVILMSKCKHNIIVASSLSWWGAYINKNKDKLVITPKIWYNDMKYDINNYNLKGWAEL
jgi:hypothetical protein